MYARQPARVKTFRSGTSTDRPRRRPRFRIADESEREPGAAAIAVDLLVIGLFAAVVIVTRTGLFRTED